MDIQFHASTLEMINGVVWDCQSINLKYEKSIFVNSSVCLLSIGHTFAQRKQVTIKAGTIVPLQSVNTVLAREVEEGQTVDFRVSQDVLCK